MSSDVKRNCEFVGTISERIAKVCKYRKTIREAPNKCDLTEDQMLEECPVIVAVLTNVKRGIRFGQRVKN